MNEAKISDLLVRRRETNECLSNCVLILFSIKVGWDSRVRALSPYCRLLIVFFDMHTADKPGTKWHAHSEVRQFIKKYMWYLSCIISKLLKLEWIWTWWCPNLCRVYSLYKTDISCRGLGASQLLVVSQQHAVSFIDTEQPAFGIITYFACLQHTLVSGLMALFLLLSPRGSQRLYVNWAEIPTCG